MATGAPTPVRALESRVRYIYNYILISLYNSIPLDLLDLDLESCEIWLLRISISYLTSLLYSSHNFVSVRIYDASSSKQQSVT